jgi:cytochrome c-type biogenesis protein CcmH
MSWLPIIALALAGFAAAVFVLKLPRALWTLFGAALLFGLTGYALQGNPAQPAAPKQAQEEVTEVNELMIEARREFFEEAKQGSRFLITADAFARAGDYEASANFLRNAIEDDPNDGEAWVALGNALVEHAGGQLTAASLYAYAQGEKVLPGNPAPAYFVGLGFLRAGEPGRTRAIWAQLLEEAPDDAEWRPVLAERLGRLDAMLNASGVSQSGLSQTPPAKGTTLPPTQ